MRHSCCKAHNTKQLTAEGLHYSVASYLFNELWYAEAQRSGHVLYIFNINGELF